MTTNKVEVVDTTLDHVLAIRKDLRQADVLEATRQGINPWVGSIEAYETACWRRTGLINGEPAAMWGVSGNLLGVKGHPYLITTNKIYLISATKFAKIYIDEVKTMKKLFPVLENYVDASYHEAVRLLKIAGFEVSKPIYINDYPFRRFSLTSD